MLLRRLPSRVLLLRPPLEFGPGWDVAALATPIYGTDLYNTCEEKGYRRMEMTPDNIACSFSEGGMIETEDWTIPQMLAMADEFKLQGSWLRRSVRRLRRKMGGSKKSSL